jgi:hypothetical protein
MSLREFATSDAVCAAYADRAKITIQVRKFSTQDTTQEPPFVFIEADATGFEFLGQLLLSFAHSNEGCHRHLAANGPGSAFFANGNQLGIMLHRQPSEHTSMPITETSEQIL